jgi:hypothetical protein
MLTDKWRSRIHGQPQAAARKFVLASLATSIASMKLNFGESVSPAEKPVNPPS